MILLNLGCGSKVSEKCINIDWSVSLLIAKNRYLRSTARLILDKNRFENLERLPKSIVVHDLRQGIPYPNASVDAVYHSHLMEHIDRDKVEGFLQEIHRVLKPDGVLRTCVPDLKSLVEAYLHSFDHASPETHDESVAALFEQSVRREAWGSSQQRWLRRRVENLLLGDARRRGETHQWMYDAKNLSYLLEKAGFVAVNSKQFNESEIPGWSDYRLEVDECGDEYKKLSVYIECRKSSQ